MNQPDAQRLDVAIVGAGPAALYAAAELVKLGDPPVYVNLFDRLPTLGGLVRAGVAPDHADRRLVIDTYQRQARSGGRLRFHGNVEIGRDITHAELLEHHDAVIYAVGASASQALNVPGKHLPGCHESSRFVAWYNGHPDAADLDVSFDCERAVVIGNGNVALDVARILLKSGSALASSDIAEHAREALAHSRIREVCVVGRRGPAQAAFTHPELRELGELDDVSVVVDPDDLSGARWDQGNFDATLKRATLEAYSKSGDETRARRLVLRFLQSPIEVLGRGRVEGIRLVRNQLVASEDGGLKAVASQQTEDLAAGLVVHAIGYRGKPLADLPFDDGRGIVPNRDGRVLVLDDDVMPGAYVVGWIKRGPRGVIGSNKACARQTVRALVEDAAAGRLAQPAKPASAIEALLRERQCKVVDFQGWRNIDRHERAHARDGQPRNKLVRLDDMLRVGASGP